MTMAWYQEWAMINTTAKLADALKTILDSKENDQDEIEAMEVSKSLINLNIE